MSRHTQTLMDELKSEALDDVQDFGETCAVTDQAAKGPTGLIDQSCRNKLNPCDYDYSDAKSHSHFRPESFLSLGLKSHLFRQEKRRIREKLLQPSILTAACSAHVRTHHTGHGMSISSCTEDSGGCEIAYSFIKGLMSGIPCQSQLAWLPRFPIGPANASPALAGGALPYGYSREISENGVPTQDRKLYRKTVRRLR